MLIVLMVIPLAWVLIKCPESPIYLYETRDFAQLENTLSVIAGTNGVDNPEKRIAYCIKKLKQTAEKEDEEVKEELARSLDKSALPKKL